MASPSVLHPVVAADRLLYSSCFGTGGPATVGELLRAMADAVGDSIHAGDPAAVAYFTNWHPDYLGATPESVPGSAPDRPDVMLAVARGHGFADWAAAGLSDDRRFDPLFEAAADAVVGGDEATLGELLAARPSLVSDRSPLGHSATLLHYVAANGVEFRRQESGPAAAGVTDAVLDVLLRHGADPNGVDGDGSPLRAARSLGNDGAVARLTSARPTAG